MKKIVVALMILGFVSGCSGLTENISKQYSSGEIGCASDDIDVKILSMNPITWTWEATCNGKKYFCSAAHSTGNTKCKEAQQKTSPVSK